MPFFLHPERSKAGKQHTYLKQRLEKWHCQVIPDDGLLTYIVPARNSSPRCGSNRSFVHSLLPEEEEDDLGLGEPEQPAAC